MKHIKYFCIGIVIICFGELKGQNDLMLSADSLYNSGNVAFNTDQFDQAIFYYEKARLLNPNANDISINLQLANEKLSTDIIEIKPFFLAVWWGAFSNLMLPCGWKFLSIMILISLLFLVYKHFFNFWIASKNHFFSILSILILMFLFSVLAGNKRENQIYNSPFAIVFGGDQFLQMGPDIVSEQVKQITGGNKLKILDEDGEWYKVSTMDSEQGWIKKHNLKLIKFE